MPTKPSARAGWYVPFVAMLLFAACGSPESYSGGGGGGAGQSGAGGSGGGLAGGGTGGSPSTGGSPGSIDPGGTSTGGTGTGGRGSSGSGGMPGTGGASASGGVNGTGGVATGSGGMPAGTGGRSATGSGGATVGTGGSGTGGTVAGTGGAGTGGAGAGGRIGTGGASSSGSGGMVAGTGGTSAGTGGAAVPADTARYGFETSTDAWSMAGGGGQWTSVVRSTARHFAGAASLAGTTTGATGVTYILEVAPPSPAIPAGSVVTFHVYVPSGAQLAAIQPYVMETGTYRFTGTRVASTDLTANGWTTVKVTVPVGAAAILRLGVQFESAGSWTDTVYLDAIDW